MNQLLKSPVVWALIGLGSIVVGSIYNDKDKYPAMPIISRIMIIAGSLAVGFSAANIFKWNPLNKINVG